ncbi:MAG TPA: recombinase family protein [Verrucomicrobiota bacterium]|mgnify:CR=1 FL=1|nr:recombinase family protein [Verrucomicrobiota bacterium]HPL35762.1 recombinase family protein [Verrucomicrobiota bacterium]HQH53237.1 recombinase family protein [Candidatus Hydrogenedentota bacterium]HRV39032.1 recombinase family protein [Candidatus Paceibacterota bacterium]
MTPSETPPDPSPAAAYVRMSTEHQQYSTSNQMDVIREYAKRRGMQITTEYSDEGKSGLNIQGRDSLAQMIKDVQSGAVLFTNILVYDVSRWGRFQDADESAYYEYICRQAGVAVHYCAEQFENDGSPVSTIVKGVKRAMAGEYSRELSTKVFQGACRLIQMGYKQGGTAGYGLRRMLVDQSGERKAVLKIGEQKSIQTDRVILVAGPAEEVAIVRGIYRDFLGGKLESEIAASLNAQGILTDFGRAWTRGTVHELLTNKKYIGNNVYHRTSFKLKQKHVVNPPDRWIRADGVFEGIVEPELFFKVREIVLARSQRLTDDEMLEKLRGALKQHGRLSGIIIDEAEDLPSSAAFQHRFGSLVAAYRLIGYNPGIDYSFIETNRKLRKRHPEIVASVVRRVQELGGAATWDEKKELLHVNGELRVSIVLCRHISTPGGFSRWVVRLDAGLKPDITIAVRMDATNEAIRDYYLLPGLDMTWENLRMAEDNGIYLDAYRFDTLDYFMGMAERVKLEAA